MNRSELQQQPGIHYCGAHVRKHWSNTHCEMKRLKTLLDFYISFRFRGGLKDFLGKKNFCGSKSKTIKNGVKRSFENSGPEWS